MSLDALTHADFEPLAGQDFSLGPEPGLGTIALRLATVDVGQPVDGLPRVPFTLTFVGPVDPILPQRIYRLEHPSLGPEELFIVPVARDAEGTTYEAVFS